MSQAKAMLTKLLRKRSNKLSLLVAVLSDFAFLPRSCG
jgi:hypothetical protein